MSRGEKIFGVIWSLMFGGAGLAFFVLGLVNFVRGFEAFDTSRTCTASSACIARLPATIAASDGDFRVAYGDGRYATIDLPNGEPESWPEYGTSVVLERWHGLNIGVFDPGTEHLYKARSWPSRWDGDAISVMIFGAVFVGFTAAMWWSEAGSQEPEDEPST